MDTLAEEMKLRGFSKKTQETYAYHIKKFLASHRTKRQYLLQLIDADRSPQTVRLASAAITFYECEVLDKASLHTPIPKRQSKIPDVLTKRQIQSMIDATANEKHKLIIELLYSSGIRLQELIDLKHEHIDHDNRTITIRQGKGNRDRITIVSKRVLDRLDKQGRGYVLIGRSGKYTKKSVQTVISKLANSAGIHKRVSPHTLRHSFATHLLEQGTDLRYIQALLGHARLDTTQIYTRVAKHTINKIKNPLD